jgi:hypothetical protein
MKCLIHPNESKSVILKKDPAKSRETVPAQLVDATPLLSFGLTIGCSGGSFWALPEQDAFSLHLCSRTFLAFGIPGLGSSSKCCINPLRPPDFSGVSDTELELTAAVGKPNGVSPSHFVGTYSYRRISTGLTRAADRAGMSVEARLISNAAPEIHSASVVFGRNGTNGTEYTWGSSGIRW